MKHTILLGSFLCLFSPLLFAGAGHDHGDHAHDHAENTSTVQNSNAPKRLPDGRLFLPKPTQHFLQLRTQITRVENTARSSYLNAHIIGRTNAFGTIQALQSGYLDMHGALPDVGDRLKKGQLLATITLARDAQEDTRLRTDAADARERLHLAQQELQRLRKLEQLISQQEVDNAAAEVRRLTARLSTLKKGTVTKEKLYVPINGVVTQVHAHIGQHVQAGDRLLDILDVNQLQVEALSYDPLIVKQIDSAALLFDQRVIPLSYRGTSKQLQQQTLPLYFAAKHPTDLADLAIGLAVKVRIRHKDKQKGIVLPAEALARNRSNQFIVWLKTEPEYFSPREIQYQYVDNQRIIVTAGLAANERVVIQATTLINQIR